MDLDGNPSNGDQSVYTNLQIMKFAPSLSYLVTPNFSIGGALHINYGALDLGDGTSSNFGFGAELGAIYRLVLCLLVPYTSLRRKYHMIMLRTLT